MISCILIENLSTTCHNNFGNYLFTPNRSIDPYKLLVSYDSATDRLLIDLAFSFVITYRLHLIHLQQWTQSFTWYCFVRTHRNDIFISHAVKLGRTCRLVGRVFFPLKRNAMIVFHRILALSPVIRLWLPETNHRLRCVPDFIRHRWLVRWFFGFIHYRTFLDLPMFSVARFSPVPFNPDTRESFSHFLHQILSFHRIFFFHFGRTFCTGGNKKNRHIRITRNFKMFCA